MITIKGISIIYSNFALAKHTPPFEVAPIRTVYNAFSYLLNVLFNSGAG